MGVPRRAAGLARPAASLRAPPRCRPRRGPRARRLAPCSVPPMRLGASVAAPSPAAAHAAGFQQAANRLQKAARQRGRATCWRAATIMATTAPLPAEAASRWPPASARPVPPAARPADADGSTSRASRRRSGRLGSGCGASSRSTPPAAPPRASAGGSGFSCRTSALPAALTSRSPLACGLYPPALKKALAANAIDGGRCCRKIG